MPSFVLLNQNTAFTTGIFTGVDYLRIEELDLP